MLVERPPAAAGHKIPKWLWIAGAVLVLGIAAGIVALAVRWPFNKDAITKALEEASGRTVQISTFSNSYFPPGCTAEGIKFLRHRHPELTPIITMQKLTIQGSFTGLFGSKKRLSAVRVVGTHMIVPPETEPGNPVELNAGPGGKSLAISKITADGALLEFIHENPAEKPYVLKIDRLEITNVGSGAPMSYRATLTNTEPPGIIRSKGKFGPWNPQDIGATPVSGTYTYDDIELSHFKSIYGVARASGQFSGPLSRIDTHGRVDVSGFRVDGSNHSVPLATTFEATVNGTNGDVLLKPAVARFRRTRIEVRGWIAAHEGEKGKSASFDVSIPEGRVDDLLYLFAKDEPGMSGNVALTSKFLWPPGPGQFLEKIRMDLVFSMNGSQFTSSSTQGSIDRLSKSAQGEKKKEMEEDPSTVLSLVHGNIQVRHGTAAISSGSFQVTGADAAVHGTYNLLNQQVDLHGTLDTRGNLSDTTTGFKAVVVKAITPMFKKRGATRIVPFDITGSYGKTTVGVDWKRDLSRSK
ncbi:MAG: AsmA-like C-terminal region-containing protein [Bryobacteraceae bacterium]